MTLERVEVPQGWRSQDRRAEVQVEVGEDSLVLVRFAPRFEALRHRPQRLDAEAGGKVVVECRDRSPEHRLVVGELGLRRNGAPTRNLEVEPAFRGVTGVQRGRQPPRNAGWGVVLPDVGEPHVSDGWRTSSVPPVRCSRPSASISQPETPASASSTAVSWAMRFSSQAMRVVASGPKVRAAPSVA